MRRLLIPSAFALVALALASGKASAQNCANGQCQAQSYAYRSAQVYYTAQPTTYYTASPAVVTGYAAPAYSAGSCGAAGQARGRGPVRAVGAAIFHPFRLFRGGCGG